MSNGNVQAIDNAEARKSERASVLIVSAGVLAVLSLMALSFVAIARLEFSASRVSLDDSQAVLLARAALDYAIHVLRVDKYGTDNRPYDRDNTGWAGDSEGQDQPATMALITAGGWICHKDEPFDCLVEEWMPGGGQFGQMNESDNDVDTDNADGDSDLTTGRDANWKSFPLASGFMGQYAIYIMDFGASRLNVNVAGNMDNYGVSPPSYLYGAIYEPLLAPAPARQLRPQSSFDLRLQDLLEIYFPTQGIAKARNVIRINDGSGLLGRYGADQKVGQAADGLDIQARATEFYSLNPRGDDKPYGAQTAAELAYPTPFNCRLEDILGIQLGQSTLLYLLTPWSSDTIVNPWAREFDATVTATDTYRTSLRDTAANLSTRLQAAGLTAAAADQLAANLVDYQDSNNDITVQGSAYGLEAHPYITEAFYRATNSGPNAGTWQYRVELYNPFDVDIDLTNWSLEWTGGKPGGPVSLGTVSVAAGYYCLLGVDISQAGAQTAPTATSPNTALLVSGMKIYGYDENLNDDPNVLSGAAVLDLQITLKEPAYGVVIDRAKPSKAGDTTYRFDTGQAAYSSDGLIKSRERVFYYGETDANWQNATPAAGHTLADTVNPATPTSPLKPLVVANRDIYSLGELGNLMATIGYSTTDPYTSQPPFSDATPDPDTAKFDLFNPDNRQVLDAFIAPVSDPRYPTDAGQAYDRDGDGTTAPNDTGAQSGDIGGPEIQVPGKINVNTAPEHVLMCLPRPDWETPNAWGSRSVAATRLYANPSSFTLPQAIIRFREGTTAGAWDADYAGPFHTVADLLGVPGIQPDATDTTDRDLDGLTLATTNGDKKEKDFLFKAIEPMVTTRSNVFAVFVVARVVDPVLGNTLAQRRLMAIVDRSVDPIAIRYFKWLND